MVSSAGAVCVAAATVAGDGGAVSPKRLGRALCKAISGLPQG
ncbi:hypothetical protein Pd630_LPD09027 (plasmid) [Rhodococcus opacus PD630]|nr:hypothetical protein Pd630_LPD09027 [Rhodococcus opacus PD630]